MSVMGLLYAAEEILIPNIPCEPHQIDVKFDAKPPYPHTGRHIAIWCGQWEPGANINMEQGLDELIGATFTISQTTGHVPPDRMDKEIVYKACVGVEWWARRITAVLTKYRWEWICLASEKAQAILCECTPDPAKDVFVHPPTWAGNDPTPRIVGPDWFSSEPDDEGDFGVVMDVRFRDAKRIQSIEDVQ